MLKHIFQITAICLCFASTSFSEPFKEDFTEENEQIKRYFSVNPGEPNNDIEIIAWKSNEDVYPSNVPIEINYTVKNKSKETRYYWAWDNTKDLMLWYRKNTQIHFLFSTRDEGMVFAHGNSVMDLKSGESFQGKFILKPEDYPQIYQDLEHEEEYEFDQFIRVFVCIGSETPFFKQDPWEASRDGKSVARERITVRSNIVQVRIKK